LPQTPGREILLLIEQARRRRAAGRCATACRRTADGSRAMLLAHKRAAGFDI